MHQFTNLESLVFLACECFFFLKVLFGGTHDHEASFIPALEDIGKRLDFQEFSYISRMFELNMVQLPSTPR